MTARLPRWARTSLTGSLFLVTIGCGGAAHETSAASEPVASETTNAPPSEPAPVAAEASALVVGAVSWELFSPMRVDESGVLFQDGRRVGRVVADGTFLDSHDVVAARLDADGFVVVADQRSPLRVVGSTLVEVHDASEGGDQLVMRIQGDVLFVGTEGESEQLTLVGYRPELAREVLFLSGVAYMAMAQAYSHG